MSGDSKIDSELQDHYCLLKWRQILLDEGEVAALQYYEQHDKAIARALGVAARRRMAAKKKK